jgi:hypothetical protein
MPTYDFTTLKGNNITIAQTKQIIGSASYDSSKFNYETKDDGVLVTAQPAAPVMSLTTLRNAAKKLGFPENKLEISSTDLGLEIEAGEGTKYQVTINMTKETVTGLLAAGYKLYGFKAVQSTNTSGVPVVWFSTQQFSAETLVGWEEQYQAYTSNSQIIPGGEVVASFAAPITLGQTLNVQAGGVGDVVQGGPSTAISINNEVQTKFACGISELQNGSYNALCAFPLFGLNEDVIAPIEKVFFMFSTQPVNTGTVVEQSYSTGLMIDLTADNQRTVAYDLNKGWDWGGFSWAQQYPPNSDMVPLLIETSTPAAGRQSLVLGRAA